MIKVLWIGDAIISSGFSIVTHNICNELFNKCNLEVFGVRYDGRFKHSYPYHIYPGQTGLDIYSPSFAEEVIAKTDPDVVIIFNDDHVINSYISAISTKVRIIPIFPVNFLPLDKKIIMSFADSNVLTYTEFSKDKVIEINPNLNVTAIYHGVCSDIFYPIDDVKVSLGLKNYFVVGNVSTNTYRKRLDLFLIGFAKFASGKEDVRCLIHATNDDVAYDLESIATHLNIADKVMLSSISREFSDMNILYNIMDVNTNTSMGEGFGLSLIEGAACGVPILCPNHGNLRDVWVQGAEFINIDREEYISGTRFSGAVIDTDDFADKLNKFYEDRNFTRHVGLEALEYSKTDRFNWSKIGDIVYNAIVKATKNKISRIT